MFSRRSIHSQRASSSTCVRPLSRTDRVRGLTVQLGDRLEVEAVEAFGGRELGRLDAALDHPSLAIDQLQFDQARQELDMIQALGGALARHLLILTQECRKLQLLEVMLQQDLGDMGHSAASDIRDM
jgi:hypothetical protein